MNTSPTSLSREGCHLIFSISATCKKPPARIRSAVILYSWQYSCPPCPKYNQSPGDETTFSQPKMRTSCPTGRIVRSTSCWSSSAPISFTTWPSHEKRRKKDNGLLIQTTTSFYTAIMQYSALLISFIDKWPWLMMRRKEVSICRGSLACISGLTLQIFVPYRWNTG